MKHLSLLMVCCLCYSCSIAQENLDYRIVDSVYFETRDGRQEIIKIIPEAFVSNKIDYQKHEIPLSNQQKDEYLKRLSGNNFFEKPYFMIREEFHFLDFNSDGKIDVIYTGRNPGGGESDNFAFFENQGDSLRLTLKQNGTIIEISKNEKQIIDGFTSWRQGCCDYHIETVQYFKFYKGTDKKYSENEDLGRYSESYGMYIRNYHPNFYPVQQYSYYRNTHLPSSFDSLVKYTLIETLDSIDLQTDPRFDYYNSALSDSYTRDNWFSEKLAYMHQGQTCVLFKQMNFKGDSYGFVYLEGTPRSGEFAEVDNLCGWVKMEYIKRR